MRLLDLFAGRLGWAKAFLARGWEVTAIDLVAPPEIPARCDFYRSDMLEFDANWIRRDGFDFICASPPCEEFSVHGMKHFHPNPKYPELGIKLFNHTREICEASGVPYVIENVRAAQQFVGKAVHHCGPFYLWGSAVPPILPQGITKGMTRKSMGQRDYRGKDGYNAWGAPTLERAAKRAIIPPEIANCVADYAEAICGKAITA